MSDWVRATVRRKFGNLQRLDESSLERHRQSVTGGWMCDATSGGCGLLLAMGMPPMVAECRCGKRWSLAGAIADGGTGPVLVWYVPRREN